MSVVRKEVRLCMWWQIRSSTKLTKEDHTTGLCCWKARVCNENKWFFQARKWKNFELLQLVISLGDTYFLNWNMSIYVSLFLTKQKLEPPKLNFKRYSNSNHGPFLFKLELDFWCNLKLVSTGKYKQSSRKYFKKQTNQHRQPNNVAHQGHGREQRVPRTYRQPASSLLLLALQGIILHRVDLSPIWSQVPQKDSERATLFVVDPWLCPCSRRRWFRTWKKEAWMEMGLRDSTQRWLISCTHWRQKRGHRQPLLLGQRTGAPPIPKYNCSWNIDRRRVLPSPKRHSRRRRTTLGLWEWILGREDSKWTSQTKRQPSGVLDMQSVCWNSQYEETFNGSQTER